MAKLYVISPDGNSYNMTVLTTGVTESSDFKWFKLPNGLIIQNFGRAANANVAVSVTMPITFKTIAIFSFWGWVSSQIYEGKTWTTSEGDNNVWSMNFHDDGSIVTFVVFKKASYTGMGISFIAFGH